MSYQNNPEKSPWKKTIAGENGNVRSMNDIALKYFMNNFEQNIFIYIFVKNLSIMKKLFVLFLGLMVGLQANAQHKYELKDFITEGPFRQVKPSTVDTVDISGKKLDFTEGFRKEMKCYLNTSSFAKAKLTVKGTKKYDVLLDNKPAKSPLNLTPGHHELVVKYVYPNEQADSIKVSLDANKKIDCTTSKTHRFSFIDGMNGLRVNRTQVSADGKYAIVGYQDVQPGGRTTGYSNIVELPSGKIIRRNELSSVRWMPKSIAYTYEDRVGTNRVIRKVDVLTGERSVFAENLPEGRAVMSPTEDYLIIVKEEKAPTENPDVYLVVEPDDKMAGWRNRSSLARYDLATRQLQPITYGHHNCSLSDISPDGKKLLVTVSRARLTKRPTTVTDFLLIDAQTLKVDTLMRDAEFINSAQFSPDGKKLLFSAPAEAFGGIGRDPQAGPYSSMYDIQLFLYDIPTRKATAVTKTFNPSIKSADWCMGDGQIYFTAEDLDYVRLFTLNPQTLVIRQIPVHEDVVTNFSVARMAPMLAYYGQSTMNPVRAYALDLTGYAKAKKADKKVQEPKSVLLADCADQVLKDVELGTCEVFNFTSSRGDMIYGRYYLPPHFDATKKYPMIVYYYGGCSPTSRNFMTHYPWHQYAAMDYVVYVVNPGGASGFGQKHSARHVNTAGKGVAEDIIEGVKALCAKYPFIDQKHIGCVGASYGGFMTEYLQTVTDLFACAVSHAGISDHTSYWGNGNWGYSYSEVSMAEKYPWNAKDLYVDQSPLYRADKIHTPLLLTHGTVDTNVPPMESMQLFTALKLLGRDVAMIHVKGENHGIMDYNKRILWTNSILAWFEKYLKGDSTWWDTLYPKRNL